MTKPLEEYIAELQAVIDGPAGRYWCHTPAVSALIAALEQSQKQNADLQRDELAAAAAKELRRVENLYTESQKRVAELEAVPVVIAWIYEDELPDSYPYDAMFPHSKVDVVRMFPVLAPTGGTAKGGE